MKKTHDHSTVGRRDFMKMLGVGAGAIGLGGTALAAPFKDLEEMIASPLADRNLSFWVKEVDEPMVEIDWDNMEKFSRSHVFFNPYAPPWKGHLTSIYPTCSFRRITIRPAQIINKIPRAVIVLGMFEKNR